MIEAYSPSLEVLFQNLYSLPMEIVALETVVHVILGVRIEKWFVLYEYNYIYFLQRCWYDGKYGLVG